MSWADDPFVALGPCYVCGYPFAFHPDRVPSVWVDPRTDLPPDHPDADPTTPRDQWVRRPLCPACVEAVEQHRRERGIEPAWPRQANERNRP